MKLTSKTIRRGSKNAFTLIEMVLVLAIIALLVGAGVMKLGGVMTTGKINAAQQDIAAITSALRMYSMNAGRLPTNEQGLNALVVRPNSGPIPKRWVQQMNSLEKLQDPWQRQYIYRTPGPNGEEFEVYSLGADGVEGTDDISSAE